MSIRKPHIIIPLTTLFLGFIPMVILSAITNSFWFSSTYAFPLVVIPSVLFGDSLILPILNYKIYDSITSANINSKINYTLMVISTMISLLINSYSHYLWTQDEFTGFMDTRLGYLSVAGWWHWFYSVLQLSVILYFVFMWIKYIQTMNARSYRSFLQTWLVFIGFTLLNFPGFFIKNGFIFYNQSWLESLGKELSSFFPMVASVLFLVLVITARRKYVKW